MKKAKLFFTAIFISFFFASCFEPIYYEARKDVVPTKATMFGNVLEITRITVGEKEFLALGANGEIKYKQKDKSEYGQWKTYDNIPFEKLKYDSKNSKFDGEQLLKILADENALFLVSAKYSPNDDLGTTEVDRIIVRAAQISANSDGETWNSDIEWKTIIEDSERKYFNFYYSDDYQYNGGFAIFQTNSPIAKNRKVFLRSGGKIYELSYESGIQEFSDVKSGDGANARSSANSAIYFNGEFLFFESTASTTNETYETEATRFYFAKGNDLWYNKENNSTKTEKALNAENKISCLATTQNSIIIGRGDFSDNNTSVSGGIARALLTNGEPATQLSRFESNALSQLPTSYFINSIVNATPEKTEEESSIYASNSFKGTGSSNNASFNNIGLWSFYPDRNNWNRE